MGNVTDPYQLKMLKERKAKALIAGGVSSLSLGLALTLLTSLAASFQAFMCCFGASSLAAWLP